jgi:hypothetical protein
MPGWCLAPASGFQDSSNPMNGPIRSMSVKAALGSNACIKVPASERRPRTADRQFTFTRDGNGGCCEIIGTASRPIGTAPRPACNETAACAGVREARQTRHACPAVVTASWVGGGGRLDPPEALDIRPGRQNPAGPSPSPPRPHTKVHCKPTAPVSPYSLSPRWGGAVRRGRGRRGGGEPLPRAPPCSSHSPLPRVRVHPPGPRRRHPAHRVPARRARDRDKPERGGEEGRSRSQEGPGHFPPNAGHCSARRRAARAAWPLAVARSRAVFPLCRPPPRVGQNSEKGCRWGGGCTAL